MMFRLRSNDVAPKARNDVPFVCDKRYFDSVGEGFPLPSIIAKITVCLQIVGDGAFDVPPIIAKQPSVRKSYGTANKTMYRPRAI